jgi:hypothetical protein
MFHSVMTILQSTYAALEAEYSLDPAPERIPATMVQHVVSNKLSTAHDTSQLIPDAVAMIDPPECSLPPLPVTCMAALAYLMARKAL